MNKKELQFYTVQSIKKSVFDSLGCWPMFWVWEFVTVFLMVQVEDLQFWPLKPKEKNSSPKHQFAHQKRTTHSINGIKMQRIFFSPISKMLYVDPLPQDDNNIIGKYRYTSWKKQQQLQEFHIKFISTKNSFKYLLASKQNSRATIQKLYVHSHCESSEHADIFGL